MKKDDVMLSLVLDPIQLVQRISSDNTKQFDLKYKWGI